MAFMSVPGSKPGFNHAQKLSYQTMDPNRVDSIGTKFEPQTSIVGTYVYGFDG